jgi:two-component system response regulator WspF
MKIGIANSQPAAIDILRRAVMLAPSHRVIWTAASGAEAVELCTTDAPDLVLMDLMVSGMDGVEATRQITERAPCAVMIVTDSVQANAARVFEAMGYGALDAVDMPAADSANLGDSAAALLTKIATISRLIGDNNARSVPSAPPAPRSSGPAARSLVAIGASAGGPPALAALLRGLPATFNAAIVIVQHVDAQFALGMAAWLGGQTGLPVRVAANGDRVVAGTVLLAGSNDHLVFTSPDRFGYTREPHQAVYRPSIDVFFHSLIRHWRGEAVGVLLTGMGRDGAAGLKAMRNKGLYTIAQDEASSAVYGMPKAANAMEAAVDILPIDKIAPKLVQALTARPVSHCLNA